MNRWMLVLFLLCQGTGELCGWVWPHLAGALGPSLWVVSVVLLLPGDFIGQWMIEHWLWGSSYKLGQLQWAKVAADLILNGIVWALIGYAVTRLKATRFRSP